MSYVNFAYLYTELAQQQKQQDRPGPAGTGQHPTQDHTRPHPDQAGTRPTGPGGYGDCDYHPPIYIIPYSER